MLVSSSFASRPIAHQVPHGASRTDGRASNTAMVARKHAMYNRWNRVPSDPSSTPLVVRLDSWRLRDGVLMISRSRLCPAVAVSNECRCREIVPFDCGVVAGLRLVCCIRPACSSLVSDVPHDGWPFVKSPCVHMPHNGSSSHAKRRHVSIFWGSQIAASPPVAACARGSTTAARDPKRLTYRQRRAEAASQARGIHWLPSLPLPGHCRPLAAYRCRFAPLCQSAKSDRRAPNSSQAACRGGVLCRSSTSRKVFGPDDQTATART